MTFIPLGSFQDGGNSISLLAEFGIEDPGSNYPSIEVVFGRNMLQMAVAASLLDMDEVVTNKHNVILSPRS